MSPQNRIGTDYVFTRRLIAGSVDLVGLGPLVLPVPFGYRRRQIYAAVVWQGFQDWSAEGLLEIVSGGSGQESYRQRWGTTYDGSAGSTQSTWAASDNGTGWRAAANGWPVADVWTYQPATHPNGIPSNPPSDCVQWRSINRPDGANPEAVQVSMHPSLYIGDMDALRFSFLNRTVTTTEAQPVVEIYLGVKSFTS